MFTDECNTILEGVNTAESVLSTLLDEGLVENAYGDEIREALTKLSRAEDEANYIDNEPDANEDVDLEDLAMDVKRLEDSIDEIEGSCNDAQVRVEDIKSSLSDYL